MKVLGKHIMTFLLGIVLTYPVYGQDYEQYKSDINKVVQNVSKADQINIEAQVSVLKDANLVQSFTATIKKKGASTYRKIRNVDTYFMNGSYVVVDHDEKVVQYGNVNQKESTSKKIKESLQLQYLDSLIQNNEFNVSKSSDENGEVEYQITTNQSLIYKTILRIDNNDSTLKSIEMYYNTEEDDYYNKVVITYPNFIVNKDVGAFIPNTYFNYDGKNIVFRDALKSYIKQNIDL